MSFISRILGIGKSVAEPDERSTRDHPSKARPNSEWAKQRDVDFFVDPALAIDPLDYLSTNGTGPEEALRKRYGLDAEDSSESIDPDSAEKESARPEPPSPA